MADARKIKTVLQAEAWHRKQALKASKLTGKYGHITDTKQKKYLKYSKPGPTDTGPIRLSRAVSHTQKMQKIAPKIEPTKRKPVKKLKPKPVNRRNRKQYA